MLTRDSRARQEKRRVNVPTATGGAFVPSRSSYATTQTASRAELLVRRATDGPALGDSFEGLHPQATRASGNSRIVAFRVRPPHIQTSASVRGRGVLPSVSVKPYSTATLAAT